MWAIVSSAMDTRFADDVIVDGVKEEGNLLPAFFAAIAAALIGAALWLGYAALTGQHIDYLAILVAAVVGLAVRIAGGGTTRIFGLLAALFTLAGSILGELASVILVSTDGQFDFYGVMTHLDLLQTGSNVLAHASVWTYVIYAVSVIGAYRVAICKPQRS